MDIRLLGTGPPGELALLSLSLSFSLSLSLSLSYQLSNSFLHCAYTLCVLTSGQQLQNQSYVCRMQILCQLSNLATLLNHTDGDVPCLGM